MNETTMPDRSDRVALWFTVALAAVVAVIAVTAAVRRVIEVAGGDPIAVLVPLASEATMLPLGPDGVPVQATVETATVEVADPAPATLFALYAQPIWQVLVTLACLVVASFFLVRLARGRAFSGGAVRLTYVAAGIVGVGWLGSTILTNMTTNGALAAISDRTYESVTFEVGLTPFLVVLALGAVGGALQIGELLQRETEGLV